MSGESGERKEHVLELSKAVIGCLGAIGAACVGGIVTLVTVFGPQFASVRQAPTPVVIVVAPTAMVSGTRASPQVTPPSANPTNTPPSPSASPTPQPLPTAVMQELTPASQATTGSFGSLQFAAGVTAANKPVEANGRFPEGITQIYALYDFADMSKGTPWRDEWYHNGELQMNLTGNYHWDEAAEGTDWIRVTDDTGLAAGNWEVRLYIGERLAQKGTFVIDRQPADSPFFGPIHFAEGEDSHHPVKPHKPDESFASGTTAVYAFCDAGNMPSGATLRFEWYRDGVFLPDPTKDTTWQSGPNVADFWIKLSNDSGLSPGAYEVKMYINNKLVQLGTFVIEE